MNSVVESYLNELTVDVAKEVLRCPHLDVLHQSDTELYLFLYVYFQKLAIQQKHERSISISAEDVRQVLASVLAKQLACASTAPGGGGARKTAKDVFVQQRALRDQLVGLKVNCTAFAEVVEVARLLDQKNGISVPFGAVHLLHFTAVFITLCNVKQLFDLVELVLESKGLEHADKLRLVELWAIIDSVNAEALNDVCQTIREHPGITAPLLLELMPNAKNIHTDKYVPAVKAGPPKVVQHSADEEVAALDPNPANGTAAPVASGDDDGEFSGDEEVQRTEEDKAFWANLVK